MTAFSISRKFFLGGGGGGDNLDIHEQKIRRRILGRGQTIEQEANVGGKQARWQCDGGGLETRRRSCGGRTWMHHQADVKLEHGIQQEGGEENENQQEEGY